MQRQRAARACSCGRGSTACAQAGCSSTLARHRLSSSALPLTRWACLPLGRSLSARSRVAWPAATELRTPSRWGLCTWTGAPAFCFLLSTFCPFSLGPLHLDRCACSLLSALYFLPFLAGAFAPGLVRLLSAFYFLLSALCSLLSVFWSLPSVNAGGCFSLGPPRGPVRLSLCFLPSAPPIVA